MPAAELPLAGLRVLITRPAEQLAPLAEALAAQGATPIAYPTITLAPPPSWAATDQALSRIGEYAWTIFTSPSAVRFTLARAAQLGAPAQFARIRVAAVGTETARALAQHGVAVALVPPENQQHQEGLAAALAALAPGTRVLFPQAIGGRELLAECLLSQGCLVDVVPVSRTVACDMPEPPAPFDAAIFASPSALRALTDRWGAHVLDGKLIAAIGPTTAAAARDAGLTVGAVANAPSVAALVDALVAHRRMR